MKLTIDKKRNVAIIEVPLQAPRTSSTGATCNIAEVRNQYTGLSHDNGKELKVSAAVYFKP